MKGRKEEISKNTYEKPQGYQLLPVATIYIFFHQIDSALATFQEA